MRTTGMRTIVLLLAIVSQAYSFSWMPKEAAEWAINKFVEMEKNRSMEVSRGVDRRPSHPFITGDGFRSICNHICDDSNRCRMVPENVKDGECVFVKSDFFDFFAKEVTKRIPGKYVIVSHNGDISAPDGQDDAPRVGMPRFVTSDILEKEYMAGRLLAHHAQNLWWKNYTEKSRPNFLHCLPIGFENRQYPVGRRVHDYVDALRRNVLHRPDYSLEEEASKPLLLVAFYPKSRIPDRHKVLKIIGAIPPRGQPKPTNPFYNETDLNHDEWLDAIVHHRFVLAPFGHGLDTHRISEILMMGGIPVVRKSTISSCYDDSDNHMGHLSRGSVPMVWLNSWEELTKEKLEEEWKRIISFPKSHWDWKRVFIDHWIDRIRATETMKMLH